MVVGAVVVVDRDAASSGRLELTDTLDTDDGAWALEVLTSELDRAKSQASVKRLTFQLTVGLLAPVNLVNFLVFPVMVTVPAVVLSVLIVGFRWAKYRTAAHTLSDVQQRLYSLERAG